MIDARLAVLLSGTGTILQAMIEAGVPIDLVVSDRDCEAENIAFRSDIPVMRICRTIFGWDTTLPWNRQSHFEREAFSDFVTASLQQEGIDLIALAGFMTILTGSFHNSYQHRVINTHPSLLPAFPGAHAVREALAAGLNQTGFTIHMVTEKVDCGPTIYQEAVAIRRGDTVESLHERIKQRERIAYPFILKQILAGERALPPASAYFTT